MNQKQNQISNVREVCHATQWCFKNCMETGIPISGKKKIPGDAEESIVQQRSHFPSCGNARGFQENSSDHSIIKRFQSARATWRTLAVREHWESNQGAWAAGFVKTETFHPNISHERYVYWEISNQICLPSFQRAPPHRRSKQRSRSRVSFRSYTDTRGNSRSYAVSFSPQLPAAKELSLGTKKGLHTLTSSI